MLLGIRLSLSERFGRHDVELDVMTVHFEVAAHQVAPLVDTVIGGDQAGREFHVEQRPAGLNMVHPGGALDDCGRASPVRSLHGAYAFGKGQAGSAPVRHRTGYAAEIDVARSRQHLDTVAAASCIGLAVDFPDTSVEDHLHDVVGILIIIAVLVRAVDKALTQYLFAVEIPVKRLDQAAQCHGAGLENRFLDSADAVGDASDADHLDKGVVVARAAGVVVPAVQDTVVNKHAQKRRRHVARVHTFDEPASTHLDFNKMPELPVPRREQLIEIPQLIGAAGMRPKLPAGPGIDTVMQRQLEDLDQVEVASEYERFFAERPDLHTPAAAAGTGVLQGLPLADLL